MHVCEGGKRGCSTKAFVQKNLSSSLFSFTRLSLLIYLLFSTGRLKDFGSARKWPRKALNTYPSTRNLRNLNRREKSKSSLQSLKVPKFSEAYLPREHISKEENDARSSVFHNRRGDIIAVQSQLQEGWESASQLTVATAT